MSETHDLPASADAAGVGRDNRWPELAAFTEAQSAFFFGCESEIDAMPVTSTCPAADRRG